MLNPRIIIDLRCLQDSGIMASAIGRLARGVVLDRPARLRPVVGLIDPLLDPLPEEIVGSLDAIWPNGYFPELSPDTVFINPSAMRGDPLFVARLVGNSAIRRVALVPEFVPGAGESPLRQSRAQRVRDAAYLAWLRRYDLCLAAKEDGVAEIWAAILNLEAPAGKMGRASAGRASAGRASAGRASAGRAKPRIAFISPFPPARSGVADYSAACVAALAEHAELALFSAEKESAPVAGLRVAPLSALPYLLPACDRVVSVLGNSGYHSRIYELLIRHGGAAICHDSRLLHFYAAKHGPALAARLAAEELQREVGEAEIALWLQDETTREATLLGEVARHATPLIFHARSSVELVQERFHVNARYLPFALPHDWPDSALDPAWKQAAKERRGLDPSKIHIASFGFMTASKGAGIALAAIRLLADRGCAVHLHFVGEPDPLGSPVRALVAGLGLENHVSLPTGYVSEAVYRDYFLAADIGLQLRHSGAGSISGALQDCIAAGLPAVANAALAAALDAPGYVIRVPDRLDARDIAAALGGLIENPPVGVAQERAVYCDSRSMANYARGLCEVLGV